MPDIARLAGTPFTMAISQDEDPFDTASMARALAEWAVEADVVEIRAGLHDGAMWMCLSGDGGDLYIRIRSYSTRSPGRAGVSGTRPVSPRARSLCAGGHGAASGMGSRCRSQPGPGG